MDKRQKKFYKEMNKGIKQYERKSKNEYDHYGKVNTRKEQYEETEKPKRGCSHFIFGFIRFILYSVLASVIATVIGKILMRIF